MESRKRDETRKPVRRDDHSPLLFLREFLAWIELWQAMPTKMKLSSETFFALRNTFHGLAELCEYLFDTTDLSYILLGKVNSDAIEHRFGVYRQLSGANFFVSLKQFLENEKKLWLRCLIQFDGLTVNEIKKLGDAQHEIANEKSEEDSVVLMSFLEDSDSNSANNLSSLKDLEGIMLYCAGYVSRSLLKSNKCEKCKQLLVQSNKEAPEVDFTEECSSSAKESFLDSVNRGGLIYPSELVFLTTMLAVKLQQEIFGDSEIRAMFMQFQNPCDVFVKCFEKRISASTDMNDILSQTCDDEHTYFRLTSVIDI